MIIGGTTNGYLILSRTLIINQAAKYLYIYIRLLSKNVILAWVNETKNCTLRKRYTEFCHKNQINVSSMKVLPQVSYFLEILFLLQKFVDKFYFCIALEKNVLGF